MEQEKTQDNPGYIHTMTDKQACDIQGYMSKTNELMSYYGNWHVEGAGQMSIMAPNKGANRAAGKHKVRKSTMETELYCVIVTDTNFKHRQESW